MDSRRSSRCRCVLGVNTSEIYNRGCLSGINLPRTSAALALTLTMKRINTQRALTRVIPTISDAWQRLRKRQGRLNAASLPTPISQKSASKIASLKKTMALTKRTSIVVFGDHRIFPLCALQTSTFHQLDDHQVVLLLLVVHLLILPFYLHNWHAPISRPRGRSLYSRRPRSQKFPNHR